jgi:hypothetical protein
MAHEDKSEKDGQQEFEGELAEPLEPPIVGPLADEDIKRAKAVERSALINRKMHLLLDHFQIKSGPEQWYVLAYTLATQIVPGLKDKVKKGRPAKWTDFELAILYVEVARREREKGCGVEDACHDLAKEHPWKELLGKWEGKHIADGSEPGKALQKQYERAKRLDDRWLNIAEDVYQLHRKRSDLASWQQLVDMVPEKKK